MTIVPADAHFVEVGMQWVWDHAGEIHVLGVVERIDRIHGWASVRAVDDAEDFVNSRLTDGRRVIFDALEGDGCLRVSTCFLQEKTDDPTVFTRARWENQP